MAGATVDGDLVVNGSVVARTNTPSSLSVANAQVSATADSAATKLEHQMNVPYGQPSGTAVAAETKSLFIVKGATGSIVQFEAAIIGTIATGADRTVSVDLQKSTGAGAFATVLSAPIAFNNVSVIRTLTQATISSASLVDGDILQVVVTVAGAAGNQALGLAVALTVREKP
jgi:hypothetical protein